MEADFSKSILSSLSHNYYVININNEIVETNDKNWRKGLKCHVHFFNLNSPCEGNKEICPLLTDSVMNRSCLTCINGKKSNYNFESVPLYDDKGNKTNVIVHVTDISDIKMIEEARTLHLNFLENMARIDLVIRQAKDVWEMLNNVIKSTLEIFNADRSWLLYPCDPDAESWNVPIEHTKPEYPGAYVLGEDIPMVSDVAEEFRAVLKNEDLITIDYQKPSESETSDRFYVKSEIHKGVLRFMAR